MTDKPSGYDVARQGAEERTSRYPKGNTMSQTTENNVAAVRRYTQFDCEPYGDQWAVFGKDSDYPIYFGLRGDIQILTDLLNRGHLSRPDS